MKKVNFVEDGFSFLHFTLLQELMETTLMTEIFQSHIILMEPIRLWQNPQLLKDLNI